MGEHSDLDWTRISLSQAVAAAACRSCERTYSRIRWHGGKQLHGSKDTDSFPVVYLDRVSLCCRHVLDRLIRHYVIQNSRSLTEWARHDGQPGKRTDSAQYSTS